MTERKQVEVIASAEILTEINRVLQYEKIRRILKRSGRDISAVMGMILRLSSIVDVKSTVRVVEQDPSDNTVLACAQQASADFIVSGDKHLLQVRRYGKTKIVTAQRLLDIIGSD